MPAEEIAFIHDGLDFQFFDSADISQSAQIAESLYLQEVQKFGVDGVAFLTPFRHKTETSVEAMNLRLQALVNPPSPGKPEAVFGQIRFRLGDKVMQIKNYEQVSNRDVGYIIGITGSENEATVTVDFGDGRRMEYENDQLRMLDLGYASTVHKSQGAQYKSVILNTEHFSGTPSTKALTTTSGIVARKENCNHQHKGQDPCGILPFLCDDDNPLRNDFLTIRYE